MLSKAYFNFRNSCRFILGNLFDFDPKKDSLGPESMDKLDIYVMGQLNVLIGKVQAAYETYEFHSIYQLINKFVVWLSALYHDIVKDRLYTFKANSQERRGTQTVMRSVISVLARLMAPILSFTAEEIWSRLEPGNSVFLTDFPRINQEFERPEETAKFEQFLELRSAINKSLEEARAAKVIGSGLDADLLVTASGADHDCLSSHGNLAELLIVSSVSLARGPEGTHLATEVKPSPHNKCPRCWIRHPKVANDGDSVCPKCQRALS
jgi:isoleucyl-tRNA synthetase